MEKIGKAFDGFSHAISWLIWKPLEPGDEKRQFNMKRLMVFVCVLCGLFTVAALFMPSPPKYVGEFHENLSNDALKGVRQADEKAISEMTATTQKAFSSRGSTGPYQGSSVGRSNSGGPDRNTAMVLNRAGINGGNQLPAGVKFTVRLLDKVTIGDQSVPVIAEVTGGAFNDAGGGIKEGSRLFGMAQFQNGSERAQIQFQSIADSSGMVRSIQGVGIGPDGQAGVAGDVHSNGLKNVAGQFVTRFIGAYAEGSQQRDFLGNSRGGAQNGLLNAVGATAKDRTNAYAEDLKKEHQWIDIPQGTEVIVILTQAFTFREAGVQQ